MAWHELFIGVRSGYLAQAGAELYNIMTNAMSLLWVSTRSAIKNVQNFSNTRRIAACPAKACSHDTTGVVRVLRVEKPTIASRMSRRKRYTSIFVAYMKLGRARGFGSYNTAPMRSLPMFTTARALHLRLVSIGQRDGWKRTHSIAFESNSPSSFAESVLTNRKPSPSGFSELRSPWIQKASCQPTFTIWMR